MSAPRAGKILVASPPLGGGHRVPAQRPYILVPDEQGLGTGQAVCGDLQRFFDLWNLTLQDARQPACGGKRMVEQLTCLSLYLKEGATRALPRLV